jgi:phosphate starvation-inducible PhoH-like protein
VGLLPGELTQKLEPFFAQTIAHFEKFLGKGYVKYALDKKIIEYAAVEYLRGMSFENCIVIVEESQGLTKEEFEMLLTRVGDNSQMIFTGDEKQSDLKGVTGLVQTLSMLDRARKDRPYYLDEDDMHQLYNNVGIVEFTFEDVQRSSMVKALTKLYYHQ